MFTASRLKTPLVKPIQQRQITLIVLTSTLLTSIQDENYKVRRIPNTAGAAWVTSEESAFDRWYCVARNQSRGDVRMSASERREVGLGFAVKLNFPKLIIIE